MILLQSIAIDVLGVAVAGASIARLAPLHLFKRRDPKTGTLVRHRPEWVLVYLLMFAGAMLALLDLWSGNPDPSGIPLLAGCALYLWLSRVTWRTGPPAHITIEEAP